MLIYSGGYRVNNYGDGDDINKRDMLMSYIENNVGEIVNFYDFNDSYLVLYENLPRENKTIQTGKFIRYWSKNKEELEAYLSSKKYNL